MAASKSLSTIIAAATSNSAGGTTTGTAVDLTTKYGALVTIKISNGATPPSAAASAKIYVSGDNTNWKLFYTVGHTLNASEVGEWAIDIPRPAMYVRVDVTGNTVQAVNCEAFAQVLTGI